jgi:hypothetical protein
MYTRWASAPPSAWRSWAAMMLAGSLLAAMHGGGLVGVLQGMQAVGVHRGSPGVAVEAELADPLVGPAGDDRLAGRVAGGVAEVAALG